MAKANEEASLELKWLKKRGGGGKKKEIQFYESFIYDGVEYTLYDCVYMYKESLPEPYIGKLIKIWEHSDKSKKVKVHWFFRVGEILKWLGDNETLDDEVFLASGEGVGLANVNPLEAIAGKCNVVCISEDSRNPKPSDDELKKAEYLFYRTFDVQSCTILDKMDDKVGGLEIEHIFNRKESENASSVPKLNSDRNEDNKNTSTFSDTQQLVTQNPSDKTKTLMADENNDPLMVKVNVNESSVGRESVPGKEPASGAAVGSSKITATNAEIGKAIACKVDSDKDEIKLSQGPVNQVEVREKVKSAIDSNGLKERPSKKAGPEKASSGAGVGSSKIAATNAEIGKTIACKVDSDKDEIKLSKGPVNQVEDREKVKSAIDSNGLKERPSKKAGPEKPASGAGVGSSKIAAINAEIRKTIASKVDSDEDDIKLRAGPANQVEVRERVKSAIDSDGLKDRPSKKAGSEGKKMKRDEKLPLDENDVKALVTSVTSGDKPNHKHGKVPLRSDKEMVSAKDFCDMESRPLKKARVDNSLKLSEDKKVPKKEQADDNSLKLSEDKNKKSIQKLSTNSNGNKAKDLASTSTSSEEKPKARLALESPAMKRVSKKEQPDDKERKLSLGKLPMVYAPDPADEDKETAYQEFAIIPKPDADKKKWFRTLPWVERVKNAHGQGILVLLLNLDPEYTSEDVEDIIWHAFKETCTAKMLHRTAISSRHSGQALLIFKTKEVAERVLTKLDAGCLLLSNGRPMVGMTPPCLSGKQSTFFGHLAFDYIKTQREKDAVSTSHCSQPNTIEYEMGMEWCLLQSRSNIWWKKLYKQQSEELRKLEASLCRK